MKLTRELIEKYFDSGEAYIRPRWFFSGYRITTEAGEIIVSDRRMKRVQGGPEIWEPAMRLAGELWNGTITLCNNGDAGETHIQRIYAEAAGLQVNVSYENKGLTAGPPRPSGTHGRAKIASDADIRKGGLSTVLRGEGLRLAEDNAGSIIRYGGPNCIFVIGPPGAGKQSRFATSLIVEAENTSLTILDPKVEFLPITCRARQRIGPTRWIVPYKEGLPEECARYAETTDSYDPTSLLDPQAESFVANCRTLSQILIAPDGTGESKEAGFFSGNAQMAVAGLLGQLKENYPDEASLPELASIACSNRIFSFSATAMKTGSPYVRDRLSVFATPDAPLLKGGVGDILRTLREQLNWLSDPAIARILRRPQNPWRFDDLKRGPKPSTVYIGVAPKFVDASHRLFRLLLGCQFIELQSTPPGQWDVTCIADEFAMLGKVSIFGTVFAEARGHGFKLVAMTQNAGQMVSTYGREGFRNFLSGSGVQVWFPPRDMETAQELSKLAGRKSVVCMNQSHDRLGKPSISFSETGADVLTPHDVMGMEAGTVMLVAPGLVKDIIVARARNYWEYADIAALCDANPYHKSAASADGDASNARPHNSRTLEDKIERWRRSQR
jgi:type IV secretory pathway TraG/TraD family ATPase VirD4